MSKKPKLQVLHKELQATPNKQEKAPEKPQEKALKEERTANPTRGERGGFVKVTITLPLETIAELKILGANRQLKRIKDNDVSSMIREALKVYLDSQ